MRDSEELLRLIHNAMVDAGVDYMEVYRRMETGVDTFADPVQRCPHDLQKRFWTVIEDVTRDPEIGLTLCPYLPIFHGEALEYLFLSSATFGEGLETALNFQRLISDTFAVDIVSDQIGTRIALVGTSNDAPQLRHAEICFVAGFLHTMRAVSNGLFQPLTVRLRSEQRSSQERYEAIYGCAVDFDGETNEIWIEPSILDAPSPHHNPRLLQFHRELAEGQLAAVRRQDFIDKVRATLLRLYLAHESDEADCTRETIARELNVPVRYLRTELQQAGTSFRDLVRKTRFLVARKLLDKTEEAVEDIAIRTGFSELSAFCRAFREWSGKTPAQYRRRDASNSEAPESAKELLEKLVRRA